MAGLLAKYGYRVTLGGSFESHSEPTKNSTALQKYGNSNSDTVPVCDCEGGDSTNCCRTNKTPNKITAVSGDSCEEYDDDSSSCSGPRSKRDEQAKLAADLWVLNSCTVKGPAEDHFRNAVMDGLRRGKFLVVAGCVPQSRPGSNYLKVCLICVIRLKHWLFWFLFDGLHIFWPTFCTCILQRSRIHWQVPSETGKDAKLFVYRYDEVHSASGLVYRVPLSQLADN